MLHSADAEPLIRETKTPLFLLPAGNTPPNPTELLGSDTMHETLLDVRTRYQYVLIDAPPLLNISDSIVLSTLVDGVVKFERIRRRPVVSVYPAE